VPMKVVLLAVVLCAIMTAGAGAAELTLTLLPAGGAVPPEHGVVTLRRLDAGDQPIVRQVLSGAAGISLTPGTWEAHFEAPGWWHAPQTAIVTDRGAAIALRIRPAGRLAFHVEAADGRARSSLQLRLREEVGGAAATFDLPCPVDKEHNAICVLPAGRFDLQVSIEHALSQFLSDQPVIAGKQTRVPLALFHDGSALHGWLTFARGVRQPKEPVRIQLTQIWEGRLVMPGVTRSTVAGRKGFFRFQDLPPGRYELTATAPGLISERIIARVRSSTEVALPDDLVLKAPRRLKVRATPAADPAGEPWRVKLVRTGLVRQSTIGDGLTDAAGVWSSAETPPGSYSLSVGRTDGSGWDAKLIQVTDADLTVDFDLSPIRIRGQVSLRGKPVAGLLTFGTPHGSVAIELPVSASGSFEGHVARREAYDLFFETEQPTIAHRFSGVVAHEGADGTWELELELPATVLEGIVVDEAGAPVKNAEVVAAPPQGARERPPSAWSDANGAFDLVALDPGPYKVSATSPGGRSIPVEVSLKTDDVLSIRLLLTRDTEIQGRVLLETGAPIPGARIQAYPTGVPMSMIGTTVTDQDGAFRYPLPAGAREADLLILPPGAGLSLQHVILGPSLLTVTCSPAGGTLTLEVPSRDGLPISIFLLHNGAAALVGSFLNAWPATITSAGENRQQIEVENVEPGTYSVCYGTSPAGSRPIATSSCSPAGYLAPFGDLRLAILKQ
jgi:Carboxypeptidase regulatory-like domain